MPVWRDASASVEAEWFHTPGIHQGQIRWGPEQPDLELGLSAHGRGVQIDFKGAFQPKLFYDSVILRSVDRPEIWEQEELRDAGLEKTQCGTALQSRGTMSPPSALLVPQESRAGALIWWRGLMSPKLLCHQAEKEKGVWTCRRGNRSREDCVTSPVTAANSANCYRLSGNFIRPACQLKFSHKNVYFS